MPFALILIGLALVISSVRGTHGDLAKLLKKDFTGEGNFLIWMVAIGVIGLVGYNQKASTFSRYAMALVLLAMILANGGVFDKLSSALREMSDEGNQGAGAAGNTLAQGSNGSGGGSSPASTANNPDGAPVRDYAKELRDGYTKNSPELKAIVGNIDTIGSTATNIVKSVSGFTSSIPLIGKFF